MFGFSKRARLRKQLDETVAFIHKRIRIDRDMISTREISQLHTSADEAAIGIDSKSAEELERDISRLTEVYEKIFPAKADHWIRENGEIFLVAILVAMAFRAYFLQPFRIPTGSMQPTLYGITVEKRMAMTPDGKVVPPPSLPVRLLERVFMGKRYVFVRAVERGSIRTDFQQWGARPGLYPEIHSDAGRGPLRLWRWFFPSSQFRIGDTIYSVQVAREQLAAMLQTVEQTKGGWSWNPVFEKGEVILNFEVISGDHLFVDRFSYNFTRPKRGDIFVFETKGIPVNASGQFYIKRCVGLPGETLQIKDDDRLYVDDQAVPAKGPFEKIYSQPAQKTYSKEVSYVGHLNLRRLHEAAPDVPVSSDESHLLDGSDTYTMPPDTYWAMGDNTRHSKDSRYFGPVPERNLVGRAFFVYWPFGRRWGVPE